MGGYETLLFDLDNTLFDFRGSERLAFAECAEAAGMPSGPEVFARYKEINDALWAAVERGEITPSNAGRRRFEQLLIEFPSDGNGPAPLELGEMFQTGLGAHGDLYPGVGDLLDGLVDQIGPGRLALVTNGLTAVQRAKVARLQLDRWFPVIVISDEVGVAKPDPAIFDIAFAGLAERVEPADRDVRERALMIGDSLTSDIAGARAAGIATCWYNPAGSASPPDGLIDHEIDRLQQLPTLLD